MLTRNNIPHVDAPRLFAGLASPPIVFLIVVAAAAAIMSAAHPASAPASATSAATVGRLCDAAAILLLTLASRWFWTSGPRYAEKVLLRPLAALLAVLVLPTAYASIPIAIAGAVAIAVERDPDERIVTLEKFLLLIAAQLTCAVGLICAGAYTRLDRVWLRGNGVLRTDILASILFVASYQIGLSYITARRTRAAAPVPSGTRRWRIYWFNEAVVVSAGAPFALLAGYVIQREGAAIGWWFLAAMAVLSIVVTRALVEGKMVRRQLHAMDRLTQQAAIGRSPSTEHFLADFAEHCGRLILYDRATVWLQNEEELVLEKSLEYTGRPIAFQPVVRRSGEELVGRVAERGRAILVDDLRRDARHRISLLPAAEKQEMGRVSAMLIPLLAGGDLVGVAEFERFAAAAYTRHDRERVQSLAGLVAMSLANNRQHQDMVQQAVTDSLTGLYNKRQILKTLSEETARAQRYANPLSVMMLDLDGFKNFNDTYGHMQGDVLLQALAELIKQSIRASDIGGRYGGEEFIVVMPETGREAAWITAERIRARVEAESFAAMVNYEASIGLQEATEERAPRRVAVQKTISIGVATFPSDALDAHDLLARADEALYSAKNSGRNRVVLAHHPVGDLPRTMLAAAVEA